MSTHRALVTVFAVLLLALAGWLGLPSRNVHGNPDMESLLASCATADGTVANLYVGNGGATTAFWYTLTVANAEFGRERQVLFAYGEPVLHQVECKHASVVARGPKFAHELPVTSLETLRYAPLQFWRGEAQPAQSRSWAYLAFAVVLAAASALLLFRSWRAVRSGQAANTA